MKKCPTCEKTFDDSMRFCQSDGTPLVEIAETVDPYKTMVARPEDIGSAIAASTPTESEKPIEAPARDEDVLQLPKQNDPLKTMFASEEEIRREMGGGAAAEEEQVIEIPPLEEAPSAESPMVSAPPPSPFGAQEPPPSPFGGSETPSPLPPTPPPSGMNIGNMTTPPIPSPFGDNRPAEPEAMPEPPPFQAPEPEYKPSVNPFEERKPEPAAPQWTPPPAPFTPGGMAERGGSGMAPPAPNPSGSGQNQTLAIVSLVLGIISILICQITGPVAVVLGFMARGKAKRDPAQYTGSGLALGGIITGLIGTLLLIFAIIYLVFVFGWVATQNF